MTTSQLTISDMNELFSSVSFILGEPISCHECTFNELKADGDMFWSEGQESCSKEPESVRTVTCSGQCQVSHHMNHNIISLDIY